MDAYTLEVEGKMKRLFGSLKENDRRRYAAIEALKLGHGGTEYFARRTSGVRPGFKGAVGVRPGFRCLADFISN